MHTMISYQLAPMVLHVSRGEENTTTNGEDDNDAKNWRKTRYELKDVLIDFCMDQSRTSDSPAKEFPTMDHLLCSLEGLEWS